VAEGEAGIVDRGSGLGLFPWPGGVDSEQPPALDLLLLTATAAEITEGCYPSPEVIAAAWKANPARAEYFWKNLEFGIETAEDVAIRELLESS
jgi:hypothetical protein